MADSEMIAAYRTYAKRGIGWWFTCTALMRVLMKLQLKGKGEALTLESLLVLFGLTAAIGCGLGVVIAFILRTFGRQDHPTGGCLIHVLPVGISVVAGVFVSFLCEAPWELGALSGFVYPFWLIPDAARRRRELAIRKAELDERPRMTRGIGMAYSEFVAGYQAGKFSVEVERRFALRNVMSGHARAEGSDRAVRLILWWSLALYMYGVVSLVMRRWQDAAVAFILGTAGFYSQRRVACRVVLTAALRSESFFEKAVGEGALQISKE